MFYFFKKALILTSFLVIFQSFCAKTDKSIIGDDDCDGDILCSNDDNSGSFF